MAKFNEFEDLDIFIKDFKDLLQLMQLFYFIFWLLLKVEEKIYFDRVHSGYVKQGSPEH